MKRVIMSGMMICYASFLSGMELGDNVVFKYGGNDTQIVLIKGDIYRRPESERAAVTVVGLLEQFSLMEENLCDPGGIGDLSKSFKEVRVKDKIFEKFSDKKLPGAMVLIIEGERFEIKNPNHHVEIIKFDKNVLVLAVTEPRLIVRDKETFYHPHRRTGEWTFHDPEFEGEEAIKEAKDDLKLCYRNILDFAHTILSKEGTKNIAFPPLSTVRGMPHIEAAEAAVETVIEFLKNSLNKDKYTQIQFVVSLDADYLAYRKLLASLNVLTLQTQNK